MQSQAQVGFQTLHQNGRGVEEHKNEGTSAYDGDKKRTQRLDSLFDSQEAILMKDQDVEPGDVFDDGDVLPDLLPWHNFPTNH